MLFQYIPYYGGPRNIFQVLVDWGILDALLPFILIFVLIFAILQKVEIFKEDTKPDRRINGILAFVISAMVVIPHVMRMYPPGSDPIIMINTFLPSAAVILVAILCALLLLGLAGGGIPSLLTWAISLAALAFLGFIISTAVFPGFFPVLAFLRNPQLQALLIIVLVLGLIGYFVLREPSGRAAHETFGDFISNWMARRP